MIGHFVYYQFINAAIVAPDAFDIISLSHDKALSNDQRRNLASVAKILHFSASKKGVRFYIVFFSIVYIYIEFITFSTSITLAVW